MKDGGQRAVLGLRSVQCSTVQCCGKEFQGDLGNDSKGSVPQGLVLGSGGGGKEVGYIRSETVGGGMAVEKVSEIQAPRSLRAL